MKIRFIPCYKNLLAMLAVMPLSIYQAASLSQDAVLNGFWFLFIALCLYYAFDENVKLSWKHIYTRTFQVTKSPAVTYVSMTT